MPRCLPLALLAPLFALLAARVAAQAPAADPATRLTAVTVFAGQFPTGEQPGAVLDALDIVRTPGAAADINRALQTLPGVQLPDEGNALFVRGGDSFETVTLVNGLRYPNPTRLNAPAGNFSGTLNPFEARRITFSSGGFGARFGNALSGIVDLDTVAAPAVTNASLGGGLGALSLGVGYAFPGRAGARLVATLSDTAPIFRLNGASRDYPEPPHGHEFAAAAGWEYRPGAELRFFAVEQLQDLTLKANLPTQRGLFRQHSLNRLGTLAWNDSFGPWTFHASAGGGSLDRRESIGTVEIETATDHRQFAARATRDFDGRVQLTLGADGARERSTLAKRIPPSGAFAGGLFATQIPGTRTGFFGEVDAAVAPRVRLIAGVRADDSALTRRTTADPRLSIAWAPRQAVTFSLAGGGYHQIPDAYYFVTDTGRVALPPMRATQALAAVQFGQGDRLLRIELYTKTYADLVALDRDYRPVPGGTGRAEGVDVLLKSNLPLAVNGRLTYSAVDTRRTDPDSGRLAAAPFDVRHTAALQFQRAFGDWVCGSMFRFASGRPLTPIVGGTPIAAGGFAPVYGAPFSQRLPSLFRLDLSASRYRRLNARTGLVLYASVNNVLNRANIYTYEYSPDFATRRPTPSLFKRTAYVGFTLLFN